MHQHLFWVAVGVLQQGEPNLYSVGLELMEACIKVLTSTSSFKKEVSSHSCYSRGRCLCPSMLIHVALMHISLSHQLSSSVQ